MGFAFIMFEDPEIPTSVLLVSSLVVQLLLSWQSRDEVENGHKTAAYVCTCSISSSSTNRLR